ncbi:MAG TPA: cache domain-containing protein [Candidatus Ozemobacteraceae bacterium]|nr:cache domain-containing protein [Candidatus Ozemobacteraceae bacterium]
MFSSEATKTRSVLVFQGIVAVVALLIVWLAWDFIRQDGVKRDEAARRQVALTADLAARDIRTALSGAADSLQLLSRLPELRNTRRHGPAAELAGNANSALLTLVSDLAAAQTSTSDDLPLSSTIISFWNFMAPMVEYRLAAVRRRAYDVGLLPLLEILPIPENLELPPMRPLPAVSRRPGWADLAAVYAEWLERPLIATGLFLDSAFGWGGMVPADPQESGRLLAATLSDRDLIRSVALRSLDGKEVAEVSEIGGPTMPFGGWWRRGLRQNRPFFPGPAVFDEGMGRPLWQAGVPVRGAAREPEALLTAQIDLGFLGDLASRTRLTPGSMLIVTDEDGVVIGHPRPSLVVNQVSLRHTHQAVSAALDGEEGESELRIAGVSYVAAWRSIRQDGGNRMPGWALVFLIPASEMTSDWFRTALLSVLLASAALGALFYTSGLIESAFEEDIEA